MRRRLCAAAAAIATFACQAATYELSLNELSWSVHDLNPSDTFAPRYKVSSGDLTTLLMPVDIHEKGGVFEDLTVLPPTTGASTVLRGLVHPGTQLIWKAQGTFRISVIDTDGGWDYDGISVQTTFFSSDVGLGYSYMELNTSLSGTGGTYQRLVRSFDFGIELRASNYFADVPVPYELGWFNQYQIFSMSISRPPVPEPSTYAMALAGVVLVAWRARRGSIGGTPSHPRGRGI